MAACLLTLFAPAGAASAESGGRWRAGDALLRRSAERLDVPGAAWGVVEDGRVVHEGATGDDAQGGAFSPQTRVLLGSVSKPLAATVAVTLARRGVVDLDAPVAERLPELARRVPRSGTITARHLLRHTSGLPFGGTVTDVDRPDRRAGDVVAGLRDVRLASPPGRTYRYSSIGYIVLTAWLERITGKSLTALQSELLHLSDTEPTHIVPGRRDLWFPPQHPVIDGAGAGYGYSGGSLRTLEAFGVESLRDRARLATMTGVHPAPGETLTGLGWRVTDGPDGRQVWHTGMVPGYFTAVMLVPGHRRAVVLTMNRSSYPEQQQLYDVADRLLRITAGHTATPAGRPVVTLVALAGCPVVALTAWMLLRRRRRAVRGLGVLLAAALIAAPFATARLLGMSWTAGVVWMPSITSLAVAAGGLVLTAAVAVRTLQGRGIRGATAAARPSPADGPSDPRRGRASRTGVGSASPRRPR